MSNKLACIILDALDANNIRQFDQDFLKECYEGDKYNSDVLGVSGLAHTPISNPMIWGQYKNEDKIWIDGHPYRWTGDITGFDPTLKDNMDDVKFWKREDMETNFIWDILDYHGFKAGALGIPLCLPPYSYNEMRILEDCWFPHTPEELKKHTREKPKLVEEHAKEDYDFICSSIKVPDQWMHAHGGGIVDKHFIQDESPVLNEKVESMVNTLEDEGWDWLIFGDHGTPKQGRTFNHKNKQTLARHEKESVIIGTLDDLPQYTEDIMPKILEYYGVERIERCALAHKHNPKPEVVSLRKQESLEKEATEVLKGYVEESKNENTALLWTGGKEANVIADILINKIGTKGESPIPFGVVDTGNHFEEMYEFRKMYTDGYNIDCRISKPEDLISILKNPDDPRGYHGKWDDTTHAIKEGTVFTENKKEWGVSASCGVLKVEGIRRLIDDNDFEVLITGQRSEDPLISENEDGLSVVEKPRQPTPHTRIHPLADWSRANVYSYIQHNDVPLPSLYTDDGFIHTDSVCCTDDPESSEYGNDGRDDMKKDAMERLKQMGYL